MGLETLGDADRGRANNINNTTTTNDNTIHAATTTTATTTTTTTTTTGWTQDKAVALMIRDPFDTHSDWASIVTSGCR